MDHVEPTRRFDAAADAYASGRPGYPPELASWLREQGELGDGARVLDLGAGTGELTAVLLGGGFEVVAVEPSAPMRAVLAARFPELEIREERVEELGVGAASFDLVVAANALHWFDPATAFPEIARVMGRDGMLAVIWNIADLQDPLQAKLDEIRAELPDPPLHSWEEIGEAPSWDQLFEPVAKSKLSYSHRLPKAAVADFVASWSVVANMSEEERLPIRRRALSLVPEGEVSLPFEIHVSLYRRRLGAGQLIA